MIKELHKILSGFIELIIPRSDGNLYSWKEIMTSPRKIGPI